MAWILAHQEECQRRMSAPVDPAIVAAAASDELVITIAVKLDR